MRKHPAVIILFILILGCNAGNQKGTIVEQADSAFSGKDYAKAIQLYTKATKKSPNDNLLAKKLGESYLKFGRVERAKDFFLKAIEIRHDDAGALIKLAQINLLLFDFQTAADIIKKIDELGVVDPEITLMKADLAVLADDAENAEKYYRQAVIESKDSIRAMLKLAVFLRGQKRDPESQEIFNIVQKSKITNVPLLLLKADYLLLGGEFKKTEETLLSAISMNPDEPSLVYRLCLFYLDRGQFQKADKILVSMIRKDEDVYLLMMHADIKLSQHRLKEAEQIIAKIKEKVGDKVAEFELLQGKYWLYAGKPAFASDHFKSAINLKPGLASTRYFLGLTHLINRKIKLAENNLQLTLQVQPNHERALLLIAELFYKEREYHLSLEYLSRLIEIDPSNFTANLLQGVNLLELGQYRNALDAFRKAERLSHRQNYVAQYYIGQVQERLGKFHNALSTYKEILDEKPELIDVSYHYGNVLIRLKKFKAAKQFIDERLTNKGLPANFYYLFARLSSQMGDSKKQENILKSGILKNPKAGVLYLELAMLYKHEKRFSKILDVLNACIAENEVYEDAWITKSQFYLERQDLSMALEVLEKGLPLFKESAEYISNLAWIYLESGKDYSKALGLAQAAYDQNPSNTAIADTLGWAYYHKEIYSQALWLFSEVEKKEPNNPHIRYHLGMTYYMQGDFDKARDYLEPLIQKGLIPEYEKEIKQTIEKMEGNKKSDLKTNSEQRNALISDPKIEDMDDDLIQVK